MRIALIGSLLLTTAADRALPFAVATNPWVVDFETTGCMASRDFDVGGTPIVLGIEALPGERYRHLYFQRTGQLRTVEVQPATIRVGEKKANSGTLIAEPSVASGNVRYTASLDDDEYGSLVAGNSLSIQSRNLAAIFPASPLKTLDEQLAKCTSLMLDAWGFSREDQARMASLPKLKKLLADYPEYALSRGAIGDVRVVLDVDKTGQVTRCRVMRSSGHSDLDANACSTMRSGASFEPAKDRQGTPMTALYMADLRYMVSDLMF